MKKFACAYENLKVDDLHRNNICMYHVVCTYHNHAVEPSNKVAIAIQWGFSMVVCDLCGVAGIMRQSHHGMHLTALIYTGVNFSSISLIFLLTQ